MEKTKIFLLILFTISFILGLVLQFANWFSHSIIIETDEQCSEVTVEYFLNYYENEKRTYKKSEGESKAIIVITSNLYSQQQEFCELCGTNNWCHGQCGLYNILSPIWFLNIIIIVFIVINIVLTIGFILFERRGYNNKKLSHAMYLFMIFSSSITGVMFFIFDVVICVKWTVLKNSEPIASYENNAVVVPVFGFVYCMTILGAAVITYHDYKKYKEPKNIYKARRASFL